MNSIGCARRIERVAGVISTFVKLGSGWLSDRPGRDGLEGQEPLTEAFAVGVNCLCERGIVGDGVRPVATARRVG